MYFLKHQDKYVTDTQTSTSKSLKFSRPLNVMKFSLIISRLSMELKSVFSETVSIIKVDLLCSRTPLLLLI